MFLVNLKYISYYLKELIYYNTFLEIVYLVIFHTIMHLGNIKAELNQGSIRLIDKLSLVSVTKLIIFMRITPLPIFPC